MQFHRLAVEALEHRTLLAAGGFVTGGGWIENPSPDLPSFGDSYYELIYAPRISWEQANEQAGARTGGHLVTITSQEEQDALDGFFGSDLQGMWYGGFQPPEATPPEAGWQWVTGETWDYTNWAPDEPNDFYGPASEQHLLGWSDGSAWNDEASLDNVAGYVVEYDAARLTGKANFGFVSKCRKGTDVPTGEIQFQFTPGDLTFHSEAYDLLIVDHGGGSAQFRGTGTINGKLAPSGELYSFMVWAGDHTPGAEDTFRIKVWYDDVYGEVEVYGNGFDQAVGGGSIVIHAGKD